MVELTELSIYFFQCSIIGGILLVTGLYSVLWGKCKESKVVPCSMVNILGNVEDGQENKETGARKDREEHDEAKLASIFEKV